ncbi:primosomal protein N', partial [Kocuria sp. CCUG 69068]|nr:primosomal protein N' [Kocuria sp. CCUG 69068]
RVVLGTRSAAYAPVDDLGLVACFDDGDENLVEQRAPYQHVRDVLLLRAGRSGCAALFAGHAVSPEAQRLVVSGWARRIAPARDVLRVHAPRIVSTADSFHAARDPLASRARLPETAYRAAREALERGPVLVQVARVGYAPHLACER